MTAFKLARPMRLSMTGGVSVSGDVETAATPSWLSGADVHEWIEIADTALSTSGAGWTGTSPGGSGNYQDIVSAWGGGILNTTGVYRSGSFVSGTFLVIFGGGHGNYGGNELYAFGPIESDSPTWSRILDPTVPGPDDVGRSGGYPVSRHTYDTLVYLPGTNQMLCIGAPGYFNTGFNFNQADVFDFDTNPTTSNPWSTADTGFPSYNGGGPGTINLLSGFDGASAWGLGKGNSQRIGKYTPGSGWTDWAINNPDGPSAGKAAISPADEVLAFCTDAGELRAVDLRSTPAIYTPSTTGTGPSGDVSIDWDEDGGRFVAWDGAGKTLHFLTPGADPYSGGDAWAWSSSTPAGGDTPAAQTTFGTYGRFRMVNGSGWRGALVMPTESSSLYFYWMA